MMFMENLDKEIQKAQLRVKEINDIRKRKIGHLGIRRKYWSRIPWDIFTLDNAIGCDPTGIHGIPCGARIEILGDNSTCKSTLALRAVRQFQKAGKLRAAWVDCEGWLEERLVREHGVEPDLMATFVPQTIEEATDTIVDLVLSGNYDIIVWDSVGALANVDEIAKDADESTMPAAIARPMTRFIKNIDSALATLEEEGKDFPTMFFINQYSMKTNNSGWGDPRTKKGGYHYSYFIQLSIELSRKPDGIMYEYPEVGMAEEVGRQLSFKIKKNHTSPDETIKSTDEKKQKEKYESLFALFLKKVPEWGYNEAGESDNHRQVTSLAIKLGIIKRTGAWYILPDEVKFQGSDRLMDYIKDPKNAKSYQELKNQVSEFLNASVTERAGILKARKNVQS